MFFVFSIRWLLRLSEILIFEDHPKFLMGYVLIDVYKEFVYQNESIVSDKEL